jgi:hypothetical protein
MRDIFSVLLLEFVTKSTASAWLLAGEIALVIASIFVVWGLLGESQKDKWAPAPSHIKRWHSAFVAMVVLGVVGELIADGDIFLFSHRLQSIQDTEVAALNERAESLRADNLALEKILIPRRFIGPWGRGSPTATGLFRMGMIWGELAKSPKMEALVQVVPDFDAERLSLDIMRALVIAGWKPRLIDVKESGIVPLFMPEGVQLWTGRDHDAAWVAAEALAAALSYEDIRADAPNAPLHRDDPSVMALPDNDIRKSPPNGTVVVLIGIRPASMELLQKQGDEYRKAHPDEK